MRPIKAIVRLLAICFVTFHAASVQATLLDYTFIGTSAGGTLDTGSGPSTIAGRTFTITGSTINNIDLFSGLSVGSELGLFAATSTYDFGGGFTFFTDTGGDFYVQNCAGSGGVSCSGLTDISVITGFTANLPATVLGDPNFPLPLGESLAPISTSSATRTLTNSSGHTLLLAFTTQSISSLSVTATVPEPSTITLLCLGLLGIIGRRRCVKIAAQSPTTSPCAAIKKAAKYRPFI